MSLGLISRIPSEDNGASQEYRFQPARPLSSITLPQFEELFDGLGEGPTRDILDRFDPVVRRFHERMRVAVKSALGSESLDDLISEFPGPEIPSATLEGEKVATAPGG